MSKLTLIQGDCLKVMKKIPDNSVDLVLADPPYGIRINKMNFVTSGAIKVGDAYRNDYSNHNTKWDTKGLTKKQWKEIQRISKNQILFGANNFSDILPKSRCWICWDKRIESKYSNDFADCEFIWTSFDKPARMIRYLWSGMLQGDMKHKEKRYHPTQKPLFVIKKIIEMFSKAEDTILDPFLGSGTTMKACLELNRNCIGIEIEPEYIQIAKKRLNWNSSLGNVNFEFYMEEDFEWVKENDES